MKWYVHNHQIRIDNHLETFKQWYEHNKKRKGLLRIDSKNRLYFWYGYYTEVSIQPQLKIK